MTESASADGDLPRAFLTVGGRTLARHQLDLALALECRRLICLARHAGAEHVALKRLAQAAGAQFNVVSGARGLAALVGADDELVVLGDGLLVEPRAAIELLEAGPGVLVQPSAIAVTEGFERIDLHRASGGAMRIPARLVERLVDLPADYDLPSALMRIALQEGVPMREIPEAARQGPRWRLVRDDSEAQAVESAWITLSLGTARAATPGEAIARKAIHSYGSSLLHAGSNSRILALGVALLLLLALGAGWLGAIATGLVVIVLASLVERAAVMLQRVEQGTLAPPGTNVPATAVLDWLIDAALVAVLVWQPPHLAGELLRERLFAPLILIGLLRLIPRGFDRRPARWLEDRALMAGLLALAAAAGLLAASVELLALLIIGGALLHAAGARRPASG
ncbi:MAG: hypothetical protein ABIT04_00675 [Novosphingobium sp.]